MPQLPDYFGTMVAAITLIFMVVMVLFFVGWRAIDKITPGNLNNELVPVQPRAPNVALAIVVGSMILGMSIVLGLVVHGVLTH